MSKSLKNLFAIVLSAGLLLGCEQKGKVTKRGKKKVATQTINTEPQSQEPGSNTDSPNPKTPDSPALPAIAIQEDSTATSIALQISGLSGTGNPTCDSNFLTYTSSNPSLVLSVGAANWGGSWPDCSVSFAPVANATGSSDIQITATNGTESLVIKSFKLEVLDVNDAPTDIVLSSASIAENAGANALVGALSSTDPDSGDTFTYSLVAGSGDTDNGSFNINSGNLRLTSSANFELKSSYSLRLRTTDSGGLTFEKALTVSVTNVNETPTIADVSNQSIDEDAALTGLAITIGDPDGDLLCATALTATSSNTALVANVNLIVSGTFPNCQLTVTPLSNQNGTSTITLTVSDGSLSVSDTFLLTVNPINDAPSVSLAGEASKMTSLNTAVAITLSTGTDPDVTTNAQTLSYLVSSAPTNGTLSSLAPNAAVGGSVTYTPNSLYSGADSFSYQICDNHSTPLCSGAISVSLTILNGAPTNITLSAASIAENAGANAVVGALTSTDPDTGDTFSYSLIAGTGDTDNASFNINSGNLRLAASGDFEVKNSYALRLRTTDAGAVYYPQV